MSRRPRNIFLSLSLMAFLSFIALFSFPLAGQEESGWRISPEKIDIQMLADRPLQLLDDSAQELHGAEWSVDDPELAEIQEVDGRVVMHAKAAGTVRVRAALRGEVRFREIKIWPADQPIPPGTTTWGVHPIGREIADLPAVPTGDGPDLFSLEQTASGSTYLRAGGNDGIQVWTWLMPEKTHDVELVGGDWLGGALISANHRDSYTLYTVGKDGKLRWQQTLPGIRKGHAYSLQHMVHVLSQSADGMVTRVTGIDEVTGEEKFDLTLPASHGKQIRVQKTGTKIRCAQESTSAPLRTIASHLFVNIDGFAYVAFTQNEWALGTGKCTPGQALEPRDVTFARDERVLLWQIHPDGTYRSTTVEESKSSRALSEHVSVASPTGAIIPDGLGGVLLPLRWSHNAIVEDVQGSPDELIYRIDEEGGVVYKLPLPKYAGTLHDEMVLGEDDRGFATRGGMLIAFNVRDGKELWIWNSNTPEIEVFAALADGACAVQTPTALVAVGSATQSKEIVKGKAMMNWQGQMFVKHD